MEIYDDKLTLYINGYKKSPRLEDLLIEVFAYLISKRPSIKQVLKVTYISGSKSFTDVLKSKRHIILAEEEMNFCIENTFEDECCIAGETSPVYDCMECCRPLKKLFILYTLRNELQEAAAV